MKVLISEKNSKWKVVQNPLKGNFYTDNIYFENESDKDLFLQQEVNPNWKDTTKYVDIGRPNFSDAIHLTFTTSLPLLQELGIKTREEALRKDFMIAYDTDAKTYKFYTLKANLLPDKGNNLTVRYQAELDVFFTYGIANIWKPNQQIALQRGIPSKQWNGSRPLLSLDSDLIFAEPINAGIGCTIKEPSTELFNSDLKGLIVFVKPQPRFIKTWMFSNYPPDKISQNYIYYQDTISIKSITGGNQTSNYYLYSQRYTNNDGERITYYETKESDQPIIQNYPAFQKIGPKNIYKKQDYFMVIWLPISYLTNNNKLGPTTTFTYNDLLNSPDILHILPSYTTPNPADLITLESGILVDNGGEKTNQTLDWEAVRGAMGNYWLIQPTHPILSQLMIFKDSAVFNEITKINLGSIDNQLTDDNFHPNQYAKLFSGQNLFWTLTNAFKQSLTMGLELINAENQLTINRQTVQTLEGTFHKTSLDKGIYQYGNLRNNYVFEEVDNSVWFQNTDEAIKALSQNAQSINNNARIENRNKVLGVIGNIFGTGANVASMAAGGYGLKQAFNSPSKDNTGSALGANTAFMSGAANLVSGVGQLSAASDAINRQSSQLQDLQSGKNQIVSTGAEIDKIRTLDVSPYSLRLQKYELPDSLRENVAMFYHRFGYAFNGKLVNPLDYIDNGRYWSYIQADYDTVYQALKESLSPDECEIIKQSLASGVRFWKFRPGETLQVGDYSKRNIKQ